MSQHLLIYGCGSMASALARGLKSSHPDWKFTCWTPSSEKAKSLAAELGGTHLTDLSQLPKDITAVVLGFKPQILKDASVNVAKLLPNTVPYISLLAAVTLSDLAAVFPGRPLLRLMPNLAVGRNQGVVLWAQQGLTNTAVWEKALDSLGLAHQVSEPLIDVYTLHGGSMPGFVYQWLKDAGEFARDNGGDPQVAIDIMAQALRGTLSTPVEFAKLDEKIKSVASKGGVTQAVLDEWQKNFAGFMKQGFAAGLARLKELRK